MPIGQLIKVLAFEIHIAGLLGFRLGNARHVLHFTDCGKILIKMCLIHQQPIYAQFLEGNDIILPTLVVELL